MSSCKENHPPRRGKKNPFGTIIHWRASLKIHAGADKHLPIDAGASDFGTIISDPKTLRSTQ
eukprot:3873548-Heterocapsa_arctica.AAC.1